MSRVVNCDLTSIPHDWLEETVYGDFEYYGEGSMKQKRCTRCQTIEYIEFTSIIDDITVSIKPQIDEDFEQLCKELEQGK